MSALTQALVDAGFNVRRAEAIEAAILGATIDAANVEFTPAGDVAATDVQAAIEELDGEKASYAEGTWEPTLTFATPGDLSVVYNVRIGRYHKIGSLVSMRFQVITSTFTQTTASGDLRITGIPFTPDVSGVIAGPLRWQGITKASYTDICVRGNNAEAFLNLAASGSEQTQVNIAPADIPGNLNLAGSILYQSG